MDERMSGRERDAQAEGGLLYDVQLGGFRYRIERAPKCPCHVRCWHVGSGVTAEATNESQHAARQWARHRCETIMRGGIKPLSQAQELELEHREEGRLDAEMERSEIQEDYHR